MIKIEQIHVMNMENAFRGARNPLASWAKSDSTLAPDGSFLVGEEDRKLARRLCRAGSDERKFIRQIFVTMDITAPLYWWKEFDTYKVGTVANSTSTMHKIHSKPFAADDFSHDRLTPESEAFLAQMIDFLEERRQKFVETRDKTYWYDLIQLLPSSYNQTRTCTMNYENLVGMFYARRNHKLDEWHVFCDMIRALPYAKDLILVRDDEA